jgi:N4-(beta-N-acetylglucosaminyl)-L-asparaginase
VRDHDTRGLCALDVAGSLTAVVTSNGAGHKVAGRVGDAPVVGAGGYASDDARGCSATAGRRSAGSTSSASRGSSLRM